MNNKENKKLSDDYIDKLIGEIESTGDVLDDLTEKRQQNRKRIQNERTRRGTWGKTVFLFKG